MIPCATASERASAVERFSAAEPHGLQPVLIVPVAGPVCLVRMLMVIPDRGRCKPVEGSEIDFRRSRAVGHTDPRRNHAAGPDEIPTRTRSDRRARTKTADRLQQPCGPGSGGDLRPEAGGLLRSDGFDR